jgi:hypothetical protein
MQGQKMNIETEQKQLQTAKRRLSAIESDLAEKQITHDKAETEYAEHYAAYSHRTRKPKSVANQRERLLKLRVEVEALEKAKGIYQDKVADCERNVALAELYQGQQYLKQEQLFQEQSKSINFAVANLQAAIETFITIATEFFQNSTAPLDLLRSLSTNPLFEGVSLEAFLLNGKIKSTGNGSENASFLDAQEQKLKEMASAVPLFSADIMDEFQHWASVLVEYTSNPNATKSRTYVPPDRRPVQAITSTFHQVPRHARTGPEPDEHGPRSDRAFHMRRIHQKVINANTVIGPAKGEKSI